LNIVLSETEEFRTIQSSKQGMGQFHSLFLLNLGDLDKQIKRTLGMVILRGENIVSMTAESPPNTSVEIPINHSFLG